MNSDDLMVTPADDVTFEPTPDGVKMSPMPDNGGQLASAAMAGYRGWNPDRIRVSLMLVSNEPPLDVICQWTRDQMNQAAKWAIASYLYASDNDDVIVPPKPEFLTAYDVKD